MAVRAGAAARAGRGAGARGAAVERQAVAALVAAGSRSAGRVQRQGVGGVARQGAAAWDGGAGGGPAVTLGRGAWLVLGLCGFRVVGVLRPAVVHAALAAHAVGVALDLLVAVWGLGCGEGSGGRVVVLGGVAGGLRGTGGSWARRAVTLAWR